MAEEALFTYGVMRIGEATIGVPIANLAEVFHNSERKALPIASEFLQCGVDLRGKLVPVFNISLIGTFGSESQAGILGVVLEHDTASLAFYVDEIVGIANVAAENISAISDTSRAGASFFKNLFPFRDQFVAILDVDEVFAVPGVYTVNRSAEGVATAHDKGPPMLTFVAGEALYSLPAVDVHAAVPKQVIEETAITSGPCLGEITYHNRRIPVICPVSILGLGNRQSRSVSEIVVLRFPDNLLLGIAVDAIRDIRTFPTAKETQIPVWQAGSNFIEKVLVQDDGAQIYVIDVALLCAAKEVAEIASLSRIESEVTDEVVALDDDSVDVIKERERYLVVDLHKRIAVPLLQVTCILDEPQKITPTKSANDCFCGYFSRLGETIALIDLREQLGAGKVDSKTAQVLMTGDKGSQIGFLVDHVIGIEVSQWRENPKNKTPSIQEVVVQLGAGEDQQVLPFFDLTNIRSSIISNAHH